MTSIVKNMRCLANDTTRLFRLHVKTAILLQRLQPSSAYSSRKSKLDYSRVPVLREEDLEESFIRGSGPGGSNVNKLANCAQLIHKPTGIVHKCHKARLLQENRKLARQQLIEKLDVHFNGEMSIKSQKERLANKKSAEGERRSRNLLDLKKKYLEHIASDTNANTEVVNDDSQTRANANPNLYIKSDS